MKYLYFWLLLVVPCFGQVTVSDQLPPPVKYPAEVYAMTDAQFFVWATEFNQTQEAALEKRRAKMTEPQYLYGTEMLREQMWGGELSRDVSYGLCGVRSYGSMYYNGGGATRAVTYQRRWLNPDYVGPGPLVIVNPFCRPRTP